MQTRSAAAYSSPVPPRYATAVTTRTAPLSGAAAGTAAMAVELPLPPPPVADEVRPARPDAAFPVVAVDDAGNTAGSVTRTYSNTGSGTRDAASSATAAGGTSAVPVLATAHPTANAASSRTTTATAAA